MDRPRDVPKQIGLLLALSLVGGLLLAGLALPVVGTLGWAAKSTNDGLQNLPSALDEPPLAQHSLLLASDGSVIATLAGAEDRVVVPLSAVPSAMQKSIVAIEDNRFYQHKGIDVRSLLRAARKDSRSGDYAQGASTITQQYVKQVLLEAANNSSASPAEKKAALQDATEKSIPRKLREARYAIALEKKLTKDQILERYLNIAYFGEGVYGVGTAAEHYFGVSVSELTFPQSALLAGLVNSPTAFDPVQHPQAALERRNLVLDATAKYGFVAAPVVAAAKTTPILVNPAPKSIDPCTTSAAPFFCRYVLDALLSDPKLGSTQPLRDQAVFEGGLMIQTTYDPHTQAAVNAGIVANLPDDIRQVEGVAVIQPGTGNILALGQNRTYGTAAGQSTAVYTAQRKYVTGSTFKAVTLAAALDAGISKSKTFVAPYCLKLPGVKAGKSGCAGITNDSPSENGSYNMVTGTWFSVNTYFVQLEQAVGLPAMISMAHKLGDLAPIDPSKVGLSLTLGAANGTSVLDMANIYATIAAHGKECDPRAISSITTVKGAPVTFSSAADCRQAIDPDVADTETSILRGVLTEPGATASGKTIGRPAAGKTGTVDDFSGAWFVGYVPQFATAVGLFDPATPSSSLLPITSLRTGRYTRSIFGGDIPAQSWQTIMRGVVDGIPVQSFHGYVAANPNPAPVAPTPGPSGAAGTSVAPGAPSSTVAPAPGKLTAPARVTPPPANIP